MICSSLSAADGEPQAGTAPTDTEWLFVEHPGPWGAKAADDLGLTVPGVRVQLIRRHGRSSSESGVRLFAATLEAEVSVRTAVVPSLAALDDATWTPYDEPLLLVCTNGRRDRCCSELGRPVAAALADRWPDATWETTHIGGHRFSGTLLALPSGVALGRLSASTAVPAVEALLAGSLPDLGLVRGRSGLPGPAQAAELELRRTHGLTRLGEVSVTGTSGDEVTLRTASGELRATVTTTRGEPRQQSCGDAKLKAAPSYLVALR
ncbi:MULTISPECIES: sucrase ferredoxin [unclassified Nocardioides]|uniref:sucrase ferredoxin n=1 Tax=unclassified Nocardioides TaxID=2615069 RepID=UPI003014E426